MRAMDRKLGFLIGLLVLIGALVAVILIGRGGGSDDSSSGDQANLDQKPTIEASSGTPPDTLESEDIVVGDGAEARQGDTVSVQYVGALYDTGEEFDASWDRGQPFEFTLGAGEVIQGWDEGVEGMKVGGRRKLVIPPDLGYGAQGSPPAIPANATLVFIVDLESVESQ